MAFTRAQILDQWMNPDFKFYVNRGVPKEHEKFLRDANRMRDEYLGACLDYIRCGGEEGVLYDHNTSGLIGFVQEWMRLNGTNLIWHEQSPSSSFSLPYIIMPCPSHRNAIGTKKIRDRAGRLRCAELDSTPEGNKSPCYRILSDRGVALSLETVLDRLNLNQKSETVYCNAVAPNSTAAFQAVPYFSDIETKTCTRQNQLSEEQLEEYRETGRCPGHEDATDETVHPFDGWTLAWYIQRWHEQNDAKVFN